MQSALTQRNSYWLTTSSVVAAALPAAVLALLMPAVLQAC
jgi:hypothetical protein